MMTALFSSASPTAQRGLAAVSFPYCSSDDPLALSVQAGLARVLH